MKLPSEILTKLAKLACPQTGFCDKIIELPHFTHSHTTPKCNSALRTKTGSSYRKFHHIDFNHAIEAPW